MMSLDDTISHDICSCLTQLIPSILSFHKDRAQPLPPRTQLCQQRRAGGKRSGARARGRQLSFNDPVRFSSGNNG